MEGPELVFLHIPKTAGSSQRRETHQYIGKEHVFWLGIDCPLDVPHYPEALVGESLVVGGHQHLSFYPASLDPLYCALLRDPVARAISLFVYYTRPELALTEKGRRSRADLLKGFLAQGIDPESMSNSIRRCEPFRLEIANVQCRYLSRGAATFRDVQETLRAHDCVIGTVGSYEIFHRELWGLLGRVDVAPARTNRSRGNYAASYLQDEELLALIAELNSEDQKLVDWVEVERGGLVLSLRDEHRRRQRLRRMPSTPAPLRWRDASGLWPTRDSHRLQWPLTRLMVAEPHRLLYMSTPGSLDRAIRRMMHRLSAVPHAEAMLALGIDRVVGRFATGLMLEDRSAAEIEMIAKSADYFRFAIVYEPVSRLAEIYLKRFVELPDSLSDWPRLDAMLAYAQDRPEADHGQRITFRQFVRAASSGRFEHRLWLPQSRYLPWPKTYDRLYRSDQLAALEGDLARLRGLSVDIAAHAPTPLVLDEPTDARFADTPAGDLPADPAQWLNRLVDESILMLIERYYAGDFALYNRLAHAQSQAEGV